MKKLLAIIVAALFVIMAIPFSVSAEQQPLATTVPTAAVYVDGSNGNDSNDGSAADKAVATLNAAIKLANAKADDRVAIVVSGETPAGTEMHHILEESSKIIYLTSVFGGVDYRTTSNASIVFAATNPALIYFNFDSVWANLTFKTQKDNSILSLQYHNLTVGEGVATNPHNPDSKTAYPILLIGCNGTPSNGGDMDKAGETFKKDITIDVNSGDFCYFRGGDRDSTSVFDGVMTININGGNFMQQSSATTYTVSTNNNGPTGKSTYTKDSKIILNLNDGAVIHTLSLACYCSSASGNEINGDITLNLNKGAKLWGFLAATMSGGDATFNGTCTINLNGGSAEGITATNLSNVSKGDGKVVLNYDPNDADSKASYKAIMDACTDDYQLTVNEITLGAPAVTTAAPVVTDAPAVTDAPTTTAAPVVTDAPATTATSVTPATGSYDHIVIFMASAALLAGIAVIVIRKKING